jgi:hypothetical protein
MSEMEAIVKLVGDAAKGLQAAKEALVSEVRYHASLRAELGHTKKLLGDEKENERARAASKAAAEAAADMRRDFAAQLAAKDVELEAAKKLVIKYKLALQRDMHSKRMAVQALFGDGALFANDPKFHAMLRVDDLPSDLVSSDGEGEGEGEGAGAGAGTKFDAIQQQPLSRDAARTFGAAAADSPAAPAPIPAPASKGRAKGPGREAEKLLQENEKYARIDASLPERLSLAGRRSRGEAEGGSPDPLGSTGSVPTKRGRGRGGRGSRGGRGGSVGRLSLGAASGLPSMSSLGGADEAEVDLGASQASIGASQASRGAGRGRGRGRGRPSNASVAAAASAAAALAASPQASLAAADAPPAARGRGRPRGRPPKVRAEGEVGGRGGAAVKRRRVSVGGQSIMDVTDDEDESDDADKLMASPPTSAMRGRGRGKKAKAAAEEDAMDDVEEIAPPTSSRLSAPPSGRGAASMPSGTASAKRGDYGSQHSGTLTQPRLGVPARALTIMGGNDPAPGFAALLVGWNPASWTAPQLLSGQPLPSLPRDWRIVPLGLGAKVLGRASEWGMVSPKVSRKQLRLETSVLPPAVPGGPQRVRTVCINTGVNPVHLWRAVRVKDELEVLAGKPAGSAGAADDTSGASTELSPGDIVILQMCAFDTVSGKPVEDAAPVPPETDATRFLAPFSSVYLTGPESHIADDLPVASTERTPTARCWMQPHSSGKSHLSQAPRVGYVWVYAENVATLRAGMQLKSEPTTA